MNNSGYANTTLVLFGPAACGKGTAAKVLARDEFLGWRVGRFEAGGIFRNLKDDRVVKRCIDNRSMVPDDHTISLLMPHVRKTISESLRAVLDGFPRAIPQVDHFIEVVKREYPRMRIVPVLFHADMDVCIERARERAKKENRNDDSEPKIKDAFARFLTHELPAFEKLSEYAGVSIELDALHKPEELAGKIMHNLGLMNVYDMVLAGVA